MHPISCGEREGETRESRTECAFDMHAEGSLYSAKADAIPSGFLIGLQRKLLINETLKSSSKAETQVPFTRIKLA